MAVVVIADRLTCLAFALRGLETRPVTGPDEAALEFEETAARPDVELVLLGESLAEGMRPLVETVLFGRYRPLVLEIPQFGGEEAERPETRKRLLSLMQA